MKSKRLIRVNRPNKFEGGGFAGMGSLFNMIDSQVLNITDLSKMLVPKQEDPHIISRRALRGYDLGGSMQIANTAALQVATGLSWINDVNDKAKKIEEDIKGQVTNPTASTSTTDLLNKWSSWNPTAHITWKDLTNKGTGLSMFSDMLSMSSQGAASGAQSGDLITTIASGVGGLGAGLMGNLLAKSQAKKKAGKINSIIDALNLATKRAFTNQASQLDEEMVRNELADFTGVPAAYGGPLHYAFGGDLMTHGSTFDTGLTLVGNGGTHEENPNGGVPMGADSEGVPNLVEEGEVIYDDYVFSKRLKVPKSVRNKYKLRGAKSLSFADAAIQMGKESEERPNDPISLNGLEDSMIKLMIELEQMRAKKDLKQKGRKFGAGGGFTTDYANTLRLNFPNANQKLINDLALQDIGRYAREAHIDTPEQVLPSKLTPASLKTETSMGTIESPMPGFTIDYFWEKPIPLDLKRKPSSPDSDTEDPKDKTKMDYFRFAPVINKGLLTFTDALGLTNRPDFNLGRKIREVINQVQGISTRAAGQRIGYEPNDMRAAINNFNSLMAAQRSAIRNLGNRVGSAGQLLASAYNQNRALGELYAGMEKANWDRLTQAITHNTGIDQANRAAELQAAQADAAQGNIRANNLIAAAKADDAEESAYTQARVANRNNFINTLGTLGKDKIDRSMMQGLIESGVFGTPNQAILEALNYLGINPKITTKARGGKINRKKRGLTY